MSGRTADEDADRGVAGDRAALALALRLAERFGFHEGICNHFSLRLHDAPSGSAPAGDAPDPSAERYLFNPYGTHWSLIEADDLLLTDGVGRVLEGRGEVEDTALHIHVAGHRANPRHRAILHTHMPWATALTMLELPAGTLAMAHQSACRLLGRLAREDACGGLAHDADEGARIAAAVRAHPDVDVTLLANHGVVVGAPSVALAFDDLYYLERACRQQVLAMQTGRPLKLLPDDVAAATAAQFARDLESQARAHFDALGRVLAARPDRAMTF